MMNRYSKGFYFNFNVWLVVYLAGERRINSELWHACAGPLVSLPPVGSQVVYFPQGHTEQVCYHLCRFSCCISMVTVDPHVVSPSIPICAGCKFEILSEEKFHIVYCYIVIEKPCSRVVDCRPYVPFVRCCKSEAWYCYSWVWTLWEGYIFMPNDLLRCMPSLSAWSKVFPHGMSVSLATPAHRFLFKT